jgi:hypothetical protein
MMHSGRHPSARILAELNAGVATAFMISRECFDAALLASKA